MATLTRESSLASSASHTTSSSMLSTGASRSVQRGSRWRIVVLLSSPPHIITRPLATSAATSAPSSSSSSSDEPPTLLPPQASHLTPPRVQAWIIDLLRGADPSEELGYVYRRRGPARILWDNAHSRRANFSEKDWLTLRGLRTERTRLSKEKTPIESEIKNLQRQISERLGKSGPSRHASASSEEVNGSEGGQGDRPATSASTDQSPARIDTETLLDKIRDSKARRSVILEAYCDITEQIDSLVQRLPNHTHPQTPTGPEEYANVHSCYLGAAASTLLPGVLSAFERASKVLREGATPLNLITWTNEIHAARKSSKGNQQHPLFDDHVSLASSVDPADTLEFAAGRLAAGASFPYLIGPLALLEQALLRLTTAYAMEHGFHLVSPPIVVKRDIAARCGFNPREGQGGQTYFVSSSSSSSEEDKDLCLVGTAEIALAGLVAGRTFSQDQLPLKLLAISPAFRAEDGGRGTQSKGLYRLHQFQKAEMYVVCGNRKMPSNPQGYGPADKELENLVSIQEAVMQSLGLTYRCLDMPSEELGDSAYRKFDIETWMPGRRMWGEVTSASNCTDYQSARLHIMQSGVLDEESSASKTVHAHTLNATLCATPRLIITLLEQYGVNADSRSLRLPETLKSHWIGDVSQVQWVKPGSDLWAAESETSTTGQMESQKVRQHGNAVAVENGKRQLSSWSQRGLPSVHISAQKRPFSSSAHLRAPLYDHLRRRLAALSVRTGTDVASLSASFFILHEITAIAPLLFFFYLFGTFGIGEAICGWFTEAAAAQKTSTTPGDSSPVWSWRGKVGQWLKEASVDTERYARRKGWWGFEKDKPEDSEGKSREAAETQGTIVAGAFANAVAAYVVTKALLAPRLFLSFYLSPAFARGIFEPAKRLWKGRKAALKK